MNNHNALVQLFRTTRDKLQESTIPEFQIRLFGVARANQYELPTTDNIGAIVYDGGPKSITDYDVVLERNSREPENVNKSHIQSLSHENKAVYTVMPIANCDTNKFLGRFSVKRDFVSFPNMAYPKHPVPT